MKKCKVCNVNIAGDKDYCPLCYNDLEEGKAEYTLTEPKTANVRTKHTGAFLAKLFLLISIAAIATCLFANIKTNTGYWWSNIVIVSIIYVWILVAHTILSKRSVFEKIAFQLLGVIAIIGTTYGLSPTATENWLVCYVLPAVSMFSTLVLVLISFISRHRKRFLLSFLAVYLAFIILSIVMIYTVDNYKTLNHICLLTTSIAAGGTLLLGYKYIHKEFIKVFHL